jgi:hypothetical protein
MMIQCNRMLKYNIMITKLFYVKYSLTKNISSAYVIYILVSTFVLTPVFAHWNV